MFHHLDNLKRSIVITLLAAVYPKTTAFNTWSSVTKNPTLYTPAKTNLRMSSSSDNNPNKSLMDSISLACSTALSRPIKMTPTRGGGASGGGGASTSAILDSLTGTKYFLKSTSVGSKSNRYGSKMLRAEYLGVDAMARTDTIGVPRPVAFGEHLGGVGGDIAFVVFQYLEFGGGGSELELGRSLAKMHRAVSPNGEFGFEVDNTIGATPQPNLPWIQSWPDFWDTHRLGHMLKLTGNAGLDDKKVAELRKKTRDMLSHGPSPSLIHGDLWGGNKGYAKVEDGGMIPVIFDPATYYGDREADVAMTYLFGGFGSDFYEGYQEEWPLPDGHEKRKTIYNLYHILNHDVLFGGGYLRQAQGMIDQILKS